MEVQKCYYASFNVGNVEVWGSGLYLEKDSVIKEIEESIEEVAERIECFSIFVDEDKAKEILEKNVVPNFKQYEEYKDKENNFDFFILEQPIWENYEQKKR